jgi:hypothetical protein
MKSDTSITVIITLYFWLHYMTPYNSKFSYMYGTSIWNEKCHPSSTHQSNILNLLHSQNLVLHQTVLLYHSLPWIFGWGNPIFSLQTSPNSVVIFYHLVVQGKMTLKLKVNYMKQSNTSTFNNGYLSHISRSSIYKEKKNLFIMKF